MSQQSSSQTTIRICPSRKLIDYNPCSRRIILRTMSYPPTSAIASDQRWLWSTISPGSKSRLNENTSFLWYTDLVFSCDLPRLARSQDTDRRTQSLKQNYMSLVLIAANSPKTSTSFLLTQEYVRISHKRKSRHFTLLVVQPFANQSITVLSNYKLSCRVDH